MAKCRFKEWLYGPKNKRPEEPPKAKQKKKERLIYKAPPVKYECGVKSKYGLVHKLCIQTNTKVVEARRFIKPFQFFFHILKHTIFSPNTFSVKNSNTTIHL